MASLYNHFISDTQTMWPSN